MAQTHYHKIYSEATGITDPKQLDRIDEIIRLDRCGLSHLSKETLCHEAKTAVLVMKALGEI